MIEFPYSSLTGFVGLVRELQYLREHQADVLKSERAENAEIVAMVNDRSAVEMLDLISDELGVRLESAAAYAANAEVARRADARDRFTDLKADIDDSIAAGLIGGADGARLDDMIHRISRGLQEN
jgi:hypothetical protein